MDKKKYQQPCSSKGPPTDAKKSQDINNSKQFPKSSRRREQPRGNNFSKNDQPRKSNAQKTKVFDKRPKPKGQYHGGPKEDSKVVENDEAEHGSVMVRGSKKQNLNHLLNFHFTPRNVQGGWSYGSGYNSHNYNRWLPPIQRHKYNKEEFLQANCQFVVTAHGDYSLYLNDPDILVDWKLIQQIIIKSSDNLSCPICLYPPIAGKMTRCGHVYCWPCILHYLSFSEKSWHKCPICYEAVHKSDLKSVKIQTNENTLNIGDDITLRLMRRQKGSLIATSVGDNDNPPPSKFLTVSDKSCQQVYSKLLLAQNKDIMDIIMFERDELMCGLLEDSDSPTVPFFQQALNELIEREKLFYEVPKENESNQSDKDAIKAPENEENIMLENNQCEENEDELIEHFNNLRSSSDGIKNETKVILNEPETSMESQKFYYFYQADNGQNIYLHAMNVKMLEMQYGSLANSPLTVSGKLLEKEVGSFTEDLRRRMRYLCHLPVTSQFEIVEIDLKSVVSDEVVKSFQGQLNDRQRKRKKRDKEEQKREKKITEEENKLMGKYPTPKVHIESRKHFPQFQSESEELFGSSPPESIVSSIASSPSTATLEEIVNAAGGELRNSWSSSGSQGPSFAQMLQNTASRAPWPTLSTPRKTEQKASGFDVKHQLDIDDPELEEYMVPLNNPSLSDAVARALENKELLENSGLTNNAVGKKKKKKPKATVLFATNMARAS